MSWLFTQVWLWSLAAFVLGSVLTWWLFARPLKRELRDLSSRGAEVPSASEVPPERRREPAPDEEEGRLDLLRRSDELDQPEDWRSSPEPWDRFAGRADAAWSSPERSIPESSDAPWSSEEPTFGDWDRPPRWSSYQHGTSDDGPLRLEEEREADDRVRGEAQRVSRARPTVERPTAELTASPEVDQAGGVASGTTGRGADFGGLDAGSAEIGGRGVRAGAESDRETTDVFTADRSNTWFRNDEGGESPESYEWFGSLDGPEGSSVSTASAESRDSGESSDADTPSDVAGSGSVQAAGGELFATPTATGVSGAGASGRATSEDSSGTQRIARVSDLDDATSSESAPSPGNPASPGNSASAAAADAVASGHSPTPAASPSDFALATPPEPEPEPEPAPEPEEDEAAGLRSLFEPAVKPGDQHRDAATPDAATQHLPRVEGDQAPLPRRTPGASHRPGAQNVTPAVAAATGEVPRGDNMIKGHFASQQYHTPESPQYDQISAQVWFRTGADAEQAGFEPWDGQSRAASN